jgi:hypothetical protein
VASQEISTGQYTGDAALEIGHIIPVNGGTYQPGFARLCQAASYVDNTGNCETAPVNFIQSMMIM